MQRYSWDPALERHNTRCLQQRRPDLPVPKRWYEVLDTCSRISEPQQ